MKLRIRGDSIRLRLERAEVAAVGRGETVEEQTRFPGGAALTYVLEPADVGDPTAVFAYNRLVVRVPRPTAQAWAGDDAQVAIEGAVGVDRGVALALLIEKDFTCLDPRDGESQDDLFPNPKAGAC